MKPRKHGTKVASRQTEQKYYTTKKFKKIYEEWGATLVASGFQDAETDYDRKHNTGRMNYFDVDPVRLAYHEQCEAWLRLGLISDPVDLFIFEKHCEGVSIRDIAKFISTKIESIHHATVARRLLKILASADIKPIKLYR